MDGAAIKHELDKQIAGLLGPKTEADLVKPDKKAKKKVSNSLVQINTRLHTEYAQIPSCSTRTLQGCLTLLQYVRTVYTVSSCTCIADLQPNATQEKKPAALASNGTVPAEGGEPAGERLPASVANGDSHAAEANPYAFLPDPRENHRVSLL